MIESKEISVSSTYGIGKLLKKFSLFLAISAVAWIATLALAANLSDRMQEYLRRYTNIPTGFAKRGDTSYQRFREIDNFKDIDILFVGSSHCYRGFDTRVFASRGLVSFNMGSTNQSPLNSYYLLRDRLNQLNPKLVIVEVYPEVLSGSGLESFLDLSDNIPMCSEVVSMGLAVRKIRSVNGLLIRLFDQRRLEYDSIIPKLNEGDTYISGGFVEKADDFEGNRRYTPHKLEFEDRQLDYLSRIIQMAKDRDSKVLLVIQPLPKELHSAIKNYDDLLTELQGFATSHDVRLIDFNDLISLDTQRDFYDSDHLRQSGVVTFNNKLIEMLVDSGYVSLDDET